MLLDAATCCGGLDACDDILKAVGLGALAKALDPLDPVDFLVLVERLAQGLYRKTGPTEQAALKAALQTLDVDWGSLSAAAQERTIQASTIALDAAKRGALPHVKQAFALQGPAAVASTKKFAVRRFKLDIEATLSRTDEKIAQYVVKSQSAFVTDAYGARSVAWSERSRATVARGMNEGLGRADIAQSLSRMAGAAELARGEPYWRIVSAAFMNRARIGTQVSALSQAKVDRYKFIAVMDERTSEICRLLDGTIWSVPRAMETLNHSMKAESPEDIRINQPWVRTGKNEDGKSILYYLNRDGSRRVVADVLKPGLGRRDARGEYKIRMNPREMESGGIQLPPIHELCRSTVSTLV